MINVSRFLKLAAVLAAFVAVPLMARADISEKDFAAAMQKYLASSEGSKAIGQFLEDYPRKKQMEMMAAKLDEQFKNPIKQDIGNSPVKGNPNAKVTLIEWSDFQCPFCKRGKETVDEIAKAYPNDVKIVFKNLPLQFHPQAMPAAKAALAAGKQGKFWEMHDALFANQEKLGDEFYTTTAKNLGLDMTKFKADMDSPEIAAQIKTESEAAQKLGIGGTPSFLVNGVEVRGAFPFDHFKMIIDRWLAQK